MKNKIKDSSLPSVGLVIGSGGIRSLAALPLLHYLEKYNVHVTKMVVSGGGAVLAGLYSLAFNDDEIKKIMCQLYDRKFLIKHGYEFLFSMSSIARKFKNFEPTIGVIKNTEIRRTYLDIFKGKRIEDISPELVIHVTNWSTGKSEVIRKGNLGRGVHASNAFYPFFPPVRIGDTWYAEGFYTGSTPVFVAVKEDLDLIVSLAFIEEKYTHSTGFIEHCYNFLHRSLSRTQNSWNILSLALDEQFEYLPIRIDTQQGTKLWDIHLVEEILEKGKEIAQSQGPIIVDTYNRLLEEKTAA